MGDGTKAVEGNELLQQRAQDASRDRKSTSDAIPWRSRLSHGRIVMLLALLAGLPGGGVAIFLIGTGNHPRWLQVAASLLIVGVWLAAAFRLHRAVTRPLQTISNMLAALREGDYSIRGRGERSDDPLGSVILEVNSLAEALREKRMETLEATALLRKVMEEIEVSIFTFDDRRRVAFVNRAGEMLLSQPHERLLGRSADELGLKECLEGERARTFEKGFSGVMGRWGMRRTSFREGGRPHVLLVISDLSKALREEERQAWQRLLRVLGHELNNSLAPIKSIAATLKSLMSRESKPSDWESDLESGLAVIAQRTEALNRFMAAYSRLARLPPPQFERVQLGSVIERVAGLQTHPGVRFKPGSNLVVSGDPDQLEQLLINVVRNAVEAVSETGGELEIGWEAKFDSAAVWVRDEGLGLPDSANLFVPFFTTKPGGAGIGLALSRQIAEAHGGTLTVSNRSDRQGCEALLILPLRRQQGGKQDSGR